MPKKSTYSRTGAQRSSRPRQRNFELVRPVSDTKVAETVESSAESEVENEEEIASETTETKETKEVEEEVSAKKKVQTAKRVSTQESAPSVTLAASSTSEAPQSASARLAARRQKAQKEKAQRLSTSLIAAENYAYVRKDLLFILILALIMFSTIIILHFVPAIGG